MKLYAIGDLHLPGGQEKPMDVFGDHWENHFAHIASQWRECVQDDDVVLIPGDISWAMQLQDAAPDLQAIGELPGRKIIIKGNHDYWWSTLAKVKKILPPSMLALQHDAVDIGPCIVCGTRGWLFASGEETLSAQDEAISRRELLRLELALVAAEKLSGGQKKIVVMLHYPPLYEAERDTPFTQVLERHMVHMVVYGHLHGAGIRAGFTGEHHGIRYELTSCDALHFSLREISLAEAIVNS